MPRGDCLLFYVLVVANRGIKALEERGARIESVRYEQGEGVL